MPKVHRSLAIFLRQPPPVEVGRADLEHALEYLGFTLTSNHGSHYRWVHPDGTRIIYALKGGRTVGVATVREVAAEIRRREPDA